MMVGTALILFALAPTVSYADCDYHNKASMASSGPAGKNDPAQAQAATKTPAPVVAKTSVTRQAKHDSKATASPSKDGSTVVAKNN
jgi:hypothetical protein